MKAKHRELDSRETQQSLHTKQRQRGGQGLAGPWAQAGPERLSGTAHLVSGNQRPERIFSACHLRSLIGTTEGIVAWYSM